jgi:hypothetical protein
MGRFCNRFAEGACNSFFLARAQTHLAKQSQQKQAAAQLAELQKKTKNGECLVFACTPPNVEQPE